MLQAGSAAGSATITLEYTLNNQAQLLTFDLCDNLNNANALASCLSAPSGGISPSAALQAFSSVICGGNAVFSAWCTTLGYGGR